MKGFCHYWFRKYYTHLTDKVDELRFDEDYGEVWVVVRLDGFDYSMIHKQFPSLT